jgi:hypothetical protein
MNTLTEKQTHAQLQAEGKALAAQADVILERLMIRRVRLSQQMKQLKSELETELAQRNPPEPTT